MYAARSTAAISCAAPPRWVPRWPLQGSVEGRRQSRTSSRRGFLPTSDYGQRQSESRWPNLAFLAPIDGVLNLWVARVADPGAARPVTHATDRNLRKLLSLGTHQPPSGFLPERDGDENWRASSVDIASGVIVPLIRRKASSRSCRLDHKFPERDAAPAQRPQQAILRYVSGQIS